MLLKKMTLIIFSTLLLVLVSCGGGGSTTILDNKLVAQPFENAMTIYNTVTSNFNNYSSTDIIFGLIGVSENGSVVPITITTPASAGTLWIFIDGNIDKPAARVDVIDPTGEPQITSLRVKMMSSGNIMAVFDDGSGRLQANRQSVEVIINGALSNCPVSPCVLPVFSAEDIRVRASVKNGILKMLINHEMYIENHISSMSLFVNNIVRTNVYFTAYIAKNPYLGISFQKSVTNLQYLFKQSNGNSVSANIPFR